MSGFVSLRSVMVTLNQCHKFMFVHRYRLDFRTKPTSVINLRKRFRGSMISLSLAENSNAAGAHVVDDDIVHENEGLPKVTDVLHSMEAHNVRANSQTYIWLLKGCLSSGCLLDAWKHHASILKLGFSGENEIGDLLVNVYLANGDLCSAEKVFDDLPYRSLFSWCSIIHGFLAKKLTDQVLGFFSRMIAENVHPDVTTFAGVLRACGGGNASIQYVKQIHARIIRLGFGTRLLLCNPLIDLYAKNGFVDSAKKVFDKLCNRDSVSWVAIISGLSRNGHEEEAVLLFIQMHTLGIFPTPYVFSSVISACAKIKLFELGEQLHCLIFKGGFSCETYVCNALVTVYSRSRNFISAEQVFNTMRHRDGVSYNSLISGLAQCGFYDRALELFKEMQRDRMEPDCVTIASLLSACASVGSLCKGQQLHSYAIKAGMSSDIILEGSVLDLYVKCSDLQTAHEYFLTTETENVVLWNVMLVAYGQLDDLDESFHIFKQMLVEGMVPNQYTYPSILRTCTSVGALNLGEMVHTQAIKTGFQFNAYVCSVLIDMYAKHGKLDTALGILRRLTEDDVVSWTAMISGYAQHDLFAEALLLFDEMQTRGIRADNIGLSSAISSCAGMQALNQGRQIHAQACILGYSNDLSVGNALVSLYARCGRIWEAYQAFERINARDDVSWNRLISAFGQSGYCEEALQVFSQMHRAGVEANMFTFGSAVSAAANLANIKQGGQIHALVIKTGNNSELEVSNALITLYSKCGSVDDAKREFIEMPVKNEISWNAMITGYSQHGHGVEALHLFEQMKQLGVVPSHVTFVGVLSACSHVGLVSEGLAYFESMSKEHGLVPKPEHYACVVDLLSRAGSLSSAIEFITEMPVKPDSLIWRTLLSACIAKKNTEIGEVAARNLLELEPEDSATYVLISNMYAMVGMWSYRDQARQLMKERGVNKEPGRSWIEVKNSVHAFYVGDRLHPLAEKIYEFLGDLNERAAEIGYVEDRNQLWNDMEQQQKDPTVYIHSEKLAITFGLITLSDRIPIRVIKNLRVCNDCHNWIKHTSKISNRTIIVRDAYRFHHFKDGVCSCNDYW
ncbi:pentatricopeptide repeat-containing protein At4g13650 [Argentina anserina]|uniref:pentatricopeptide repeat-containing protein At4g13650 n=1 Tax=Argentina anserina TaxID=57926 RepID=UPI0021768EAB|nr:pentatricopeptide repeat-containing protein At4g13650 [Potentilla anserina]